MVAVYYIDNTNGTDAKSGLREPVTGHRTSDGVTDSTHTICSTLTSAVDDYYNGAFIYNRTRSGFAYITDYIGATKQLVHGAIVGNTQGDTFYIVNAWKTLSKSATTMAAGDIAYYRAGQTETLAAAVAFTNDGTTAAYITIIGTGTGSATLETTNDSATEIWHDASTARPIINGNNGAYYVDLGGDDYWYLKNLDIRNTNSSSGCLNISTSEGAYIFNCIMRDAAASNGSNVCISYSTVTIDSCAVTNSNFYGIYVDQAVVTIKNTPVNGGALTPAYGIYLTYALVYMTDCIFAGSATNTVDIYLWRTNAKIFTRNCKFNSNSKVTTAANSPSLQLFEEDAQQVYGDNVSSGYLGTATRDTGIVRSGGASSSIKIVPTTNVGINHPLAIQDYPYPTMRIWCPAASKTITIYARSFGTWTAVPDNTQMWLEAEYVTATGTGAITRATVRSTQTLTQGSQTDWVTFTVTVNPSVASFVNLTFNLAKFQSASQGCYVDVIPLLS